MRLISGSVLLLDPMLKTSSGSHSPDEHPFLKNAKAKIV